MKKSVVLFFCMFGRIGVHAQAKPWSNNAEPLHRAVKALTDVIVHDIFSPPVASRIYVYANIAAYEVLVKENTAKYRSLHNQVKSFPDIPSAKKKISASLASVYACLLVGKKLVFSESVLEDSIQHILTWYQKKNMDKSVYNASLQYGRQVADTMIKWIEKDQYRETRKLPRYRILKPEGKWIPTPPEYMAAIEPYWNKIRLLALNTCDQFRPPLPVAFSKDSGSLFHKNAYEVYATCNKLSDEQKAIANFWDCNPFAVNTDGHLKFASKKISPGGHWMSIVAVVSKQQNIPVMDAAAAYTLTSIALFDAFISCWDEKYRSNVIRPETYINRYIDESWRPVLQTPPFPEYTSGHSIISAAAAVVLSKIFGDHFSFDDNTEVEFGLPVRHFDSFMQASGEAAISRLYGGIHYRPAIEIGQVEGQRIGEWVVGKIQLKKYPN
ncbi:MAG TPA: vanadium-dependent haloperoxidase [Puia sp.]|nr:vanadium-dependent haloperoxidase [Puia sp.]